MGIRGSIYRGLPRRLRGERVRRVNRDDGRVALTFDDCNAPLAWGSILDFLHDEDIKASFFPIGELLSENRALIRRTVEEGHSVGSHGWDHARLDGLSIRDTVRRVRADAEAMQAAAGVSTAPYFRPPFCAYDRRVLLGAALARHHHVVLWDVDPYDWQVTNPVEIAENVLKSVRSGSIILLHTRVQTALALPHVLGGLRERRLVPVSLAELFDGHEKAFSSQVTDA